MDLPQAARACTPDALEIREAVQKPTSVHGLTLEAWSSGYLDGALIIMACVTIANMRKGVLLHKLILLELLLALPRGFWLFLPSPIYPWWLSLGGMCLDLSWSLHNVIAWSKVAPFLSHRASQAFIWTLILAQPYWVVEIYANFAYFNRGYELYLKTRPMEALFRDPWWLFASSVLFWRIKTQYEMTIREIVHISPRFGIMLLAAVLSVLFFLLDIVAVTNMLRLGLPSGINPFWKMSTIFKCLMDCVILDDFKTAMDRLRAYKISHIGSFSQDTSSAQLPNDGELTRRWEEVEARAQRRSEALSFGGPLVRDHHSTASLSPGTRSLHPVLPIPAHITPSSPESDPSSFTDGTFSEVHYLENIAPSPPHDGLVKRVEPARLA